MYAIHRNDIHVRFTQLTDTVDWTEDQADNELEHVKSWDEKLKQKWPGRSPLSLTSSLALYSNVTNDVSSKSARILIYEIVRKADLFCLLKHRKYFSKRIILFYYSSVKLKSIRELYLFQGFLCRIAFASTIFSYKILKYRKYEFYSKFSFFVSYTHHQTSQGYTSWKSELKNDSCRERIGIVLRFF